MVFDFVGVVLGDDGFGLMLFGVVIDMLGGVCFDFLFELCGWCGFECFRDVYFIDLSDLLFGFGGFMVGELFYVRYGFINSGEELFGEGFDFVFYVILFSFGFEGVFNEGMIE